jgi:hypothetical protein
MIYYCGVECQKKDWKRVHSKHCMTAEQFKVVDQSSLPFTFLNPRTNRSITEHGNQSQPVANVTPDILKMADLMHLDRKNVQLMMVDPDIVDEMVYGRCFGNVDILIQNCSGKAIFGWMLFENEFMVEAEAHCAWQPEDETYLINVTPSTPYSPVIASGYFMEDLTVKLKKVADPSIVIPNCVYWKN